MFPFGKRILAQTDTNYIESNYRKMVPRGIWTYKNQDIAFTTKTSDSTFLKANFGTGSQFQLGGAISYKWINLGYSFSLSPNNSRRNMDFRFSTAYRPFQIQFNLSYLQNLDYTLSYGKNGESYDTIITQREKEIRIITSKLKVDYVFNYRKYSYSAGFTPVSRQLKSAGSFIVSGAVSNDRASLDQLSALTKPAFDSINGFTNLIINGFDLGGGYGYNWVIGKHWTLSFIEIPQLGFNFMRATSASPDKYFFTAGFVNHFKAGFIYTNKRFFSGLAAYSLVTTSKVKTSNYSNVYNSVVVYFGWVLDWKKNWF
ncbi:hypothetical protein D3C87_32920 [compost metagenome]